MIRWKENKIITLEIQEHQLDSFNGMNIDDDYNIIRKKVEYSVEYNKLHPTMIEKIDKYKEEVKEIIQEEYNMTSEKYKRHKEIIKTSAEKIDERIDLLDEKFSEQFQTGNFITEEGVLL